ncbi:MAG TPA: hypothetical protein VMR96_05130 [Solirubrobacterales bacterium]|nr:hypothetical protein [Solirubrobacterales bacterium]
MQDVVVPYLNAVAADEWSTACNYLLTATKSQLEDLPNQSGGCATALREAAATFARQSASATAPEGLASLRIETGGLAGEGAGFALFHASNGEDMWVAVKKQRGEWGVLSTSAQPFQ